MKTKSLKIALAGVAVMSLIAGACGGSDGAATEEAVTEETAAPAAECVTPTPVKLQLQWFTQAQFAGYYAAQDQGFYTEQCLDVTILEGAVDISPQTVLANGEADFAISWVSKALASREGGADIVNIAQVFQRSGTLQVSFKDKNIMTPADFKGKNIGNWGYGNEFEIFAALTAAGLDPAKDVKLVQQQFDMAGLLAGDIDAAEAMTYNEYAQVLEAVNPNTKALYTADDFNVVSYEAEGVGMLQDAIWADGKRLSDAAYVDTATRFVAASLQGWAFCRDNTSAWERTASLSQTAKNLEGGTVLTKAPDAGAYTNDIVTAALALLNAKGVDTTGSAYMPETVTLTEGGN